MTDEKHDRSEQDEEKPLENAKKCLNLRSDYLDSGLRSNLPWDPIEESMPQMVKSSMLEGLSYVAAQCTSVNKSEEKMTRKKALSVAKGES